MLLLQDANTARSIAENLVSSTFHNRVWQHGRAGCIVDHSFRHQACSISKGWSGQPPRPARVFCDTPRRDTPRRDTLGRDTLGRDTLGIKESVC